MGRFFREKQRVRDPVRGQDRLPASMVRFLWQQVDDAIEKPDMLRGLYMPTHEQTDAYGEVANALAASMCRWCRRIDGRQAGCGLLEGLGNGPLGFCRRQ